MKVRFQELVNVLNGDWFEDRLVHYCTGPECCNGEQDLHQRLVASIMSTFLRERPVVPQLSRWSKGVASLDFWLLGLAVHKLILHLFSGGLLKQQEGLGAEDGQRLRELLLEVDPLALDDSCAGFKALNGARLRRIFDTLSSPSTLPLFWVLAVLLGGLRYIGKFLQASVHSVRVKAQHGGHYKRPPVLDVTNASWSPIVVVMQFFSSILSLGPSSPAPLFETLRLMCAACPPEFRWTIVDNSQMRPHKYSQPRCHADPTDLTLKLFW